MDEGFHTVGYALSPHLGIASIVKPDKVDFARSVAGSSPDTFHSSALIKLHPPPPRVLASPVTAGNKLLLLLEPFGS